LAYETGDLTIGVDGCFDTSKEFADYLTRASLVWHTAFDLARRFCIRNLADG